MEIHRKVVLHFRISKNPENQIDLALQEAFGKDKWVSKDFPNNPLENQELVKKWINENPNAICFSSNTAFLPLPQIEGVEIFPIIFISNPIDRFGSDYNFDKNQPPNTYSSVLAKHTTFEGYVQVKIAIPGDRQCKNFHTYRLAMAYSGINENEFKKAKNAIEQLPFIGDMNCFDESLMNLNERLSAFFGELIRLKKIEKFEVLTEIKNQNLIKLINNNNLLDLKLNDPNPYSEIPKQIVQYWHDTPSDVIVQIQKTVSISNPDFKHIIFNREQAFTFLLEHYGPDIATAFKSIKIPAMQSDVFRIAYVYKYGGGYLDSTIGITKSLIPLLSNKRAVFFRNIIPPHDTIINGVFFATPKNIILKRICQTIFQNLLQKKEGSLIHITGPGVYNALIKKLESDDVLIVDWLKFAIKEYFSTHRNLTHTNKEAHWSVVQNKVGSLYEE